MELQEKVISQTIKILDTFKEAGHYLFSVAKEKDLNKCILIFSSVVDGLSRVEQNLKNVKIEEKHYEDDLQKINQSIHAIAGFLEKGEFLKINEILQFSLIPQIQNWKEKLETLVNLGKTIDKQVVIGVYYCDLNPRFSINKKRLNALIKESKNQDTKLIFFCSKDVDFESRTIEADVFKNGKWITETTNFPDVIHNVFPKIRIQRSRTERMLRKEIPFTCFNIGNKFYFPKKIVESGKFAELLVPFKVVTDISVLHQFLDKNRKAVIKPIRGRQGQQIFFVEMKGKRYSVLEHKKHYILNGEQFDNWVNKVILKEIGSYIIQKYVECRTKAGEPFDIRAHVQKNGEGKWVLTRIYPRIGNKKSILSNISRGGRTEELSKLLIDEFGTDGKKIYDEIINLSMDLTIHIDKLHNFAFDELGLDIAIDKNRRYWLHEVNTGPQSTYHEEERAVNIIAYNKYIGENQLFYTNEFERKGRIKGQFDALKTDLPIAELDDRIRIGMLVDKSEINNFTVACAYAAKYEDVHFFYFTPKDIDFDEMLIRGYFYENKEWVPKVVEYPHVIYDRLRLRGYKRYKIVYDEFEDIPFTNEFFGNSISKLEVYDKLKSTGQLDDAIIPYQKVNRVKDIFYFIYKYNIVILKPEVGSFARGVHYIEKLNNGIDYLVIKGEREKKFDQLRLTHYLRDLIRNNVFIVQEYIATRTIDNHPFDIRAHMHKDGNGEWKFAMIYPRIGVNYATISSTSNGGYIGGILGFLERNFPKLNSHRLKTKLEELSLQIANLFEKFYSHSFSELGIDFAVDEDGNLKIIEINVNKPGIIYYDFEVAKLAIPYCIYLYNSSIK